MKKSTIKYNSASEGLILTVAVLTLMKVFGVVSWSWWLVLLPLYITPLMAISLVVLAVAFYIYVLALSLLGNVVREFLKLADIFMGD